jgi:signal peptidase I
MSGLVWKGLTVTLLAAVVVIWAFTLRPQTLGGPAMFVAVRGSSMVPTYQSGDLVVVESAARYRVGQVVAYRVPAGQIGEGKVVIHRIIGGDAVRGFTLKGDNNSAPDPWMPKQANMVGVATFRLPNGGRLIALIQQPVGLAGLAAALVVSVFLGRPPRPNRGQRRTWRRFKGLARGLVDG